MNKVIISMSNGLIDSVEKPKDVYVEIRDYTLDFILESECEVDEDGISFVKRYPE